MRKDVLTLSWDMFEQNGDIGLYMLYRALYDVPRKEQELGRRKQKIDERLE